MIRKVSIDDAEMRVLTTGQFIFSTGARAQARKLVGGWARRAQARPRFVSVYGTIKSDAGRLVFLVDKLENLYIMGYYEN